RARGALFWHEDAEAIEAVRKFVDSSLKPDETFFDFTNSCVLYYLFERDSPIREYEVPFYESASAQREVIRRLEANPKVRAAIVPPTPLGRISIDGLPNYERAPLVYQYLTQHFHPAFEEADVAIWVRN
nr:hypothetical protein [Acidobacteriota bacterium]